MNKYKGNTMTLEEIKDKLDQMGIESQTLSGEFIDWQKTVIGGIEPVTLSSITSITVKETKARSLMSKLSPCPGFNFWQVGNDTEITYYV
jgi:hypothetical protein